MYLIKCDPRAKARCPFKPQCCGDDVAYFETESECDKFNQKVLAPPPTNADRIRAMSDEELVVFLDGFSGNCLDCAEDAKNKSCPIYKEGNYCRPKDIMDWLRQPAEEEDDHA